MKLYYATEAQVLIPEEELPAIYVAAETMLPTLTAGDIQALAAAFVAGYPHLLDGPDAEIEKRCLDWGDVVGWGLRVADSCGHLVLVEQILAYVQTDATFEFYLAESFLVNGFEMETSELNTRGYRLNPISSTMEDYILGVLHRRLETTTCPREWWAINFLMSRAIAWLPLSPSADTYLTQQEALALMDTIERRQSSHPVTTPLCLQAIAEIRAKRRLIESYWRTQGYLAE